MEDDNQRLVALGGSGVFMALVIVVQGVIAWTVRCDGCGARVGITRIGARGVRSEESVNATHCSAYAVGIISYSRSVLSDPEDVTATC
jgi:hypothetical protein